jgi:hypothetical protein
LPDVQANQRRRMVVSDGRRVLAAVDGHETHIRTGAHAPVMSLQRDVLDEPTSFGQLEARRNGLATALQKPHPPTELSTDHRNIPSAAAHGPYLVSVGLLARVCAPSF